MGGWVGVRLPMRGTSLMGGRLVVCGSFTGTGEVR